MGIESGTSRKSEAGHRSKTLTERFLSVLLVCIGCFSLSIPYLGQENQQVEESSVRTVSQENPPKTAGQDAQSTTPAKPEEQPKKKKKKLGPGAFVVAPLPISSPAIGSGIVPVLAPAKRFVVRGNGLCVWEYRARLESSSIGPEYRALTRRILSASSS
jgi:hypothetical protein